MSLAMTVKEYPGDEKLMFCAQSELRPRVARQIQAVALAKRGLSLLAIALLTGDSRHNIEQWVDRYNELGINGLTDRESSLTLQLANDRL